VLRYYKQSFIFCKITHNKDTTTEDERMYAEGIGYTHMYGKYEWWE